MVILLQNSDSRKYSGNVVVLKVSASYKNSDNCKMFTKTSVRIVLWFYLTL